MKWHRRCIQAWRRRSKNTADLTRSFFTVTSTDTVDIRSGLAKVCRRRSAAFDNNADTGAVRLTETLISGYEIELQLLPWLPLTLPTTAKRRLAAHVIKDRPRRLVGQHPADARTDAREQNIVLVFSENVKVAAAPSPSWIMADLTINVNDGSRSGQWQPGHDKPCLRPEFQRQLPRSDRAGAFTDLVETPLAGLRGGDGRLDCGEQPCVPD
jgi:hypothetical protein